MVGAFRTRFDAVLAPARPWPDEISQLRQLVTFASLVEKEAQAAGERALIAGVYLRRLRLGMLLQADPTVIYAKKARDEWTGNLKRTDLAMDDPYNNYRFPGLPPGPICSPGLASLVAASRPTDQGALFFVSRNDGSHAFASSLAEHNRNVKKYQVEFFMKKKADIARVVRNGRKNVAGRYAEDAQVRRLEAVLKGALEERGRGR